MSFHEMVCARLMTIEKNKKVPSQVDITTFKVQLNSYFCLTIKITK